ncbi:MAG: MogA/MoaB family molybdenum cofactor biosynthesis protein [Phormidesmis sp.]
MATHLHRPHPDRPHLDRPHSDGGPVSVQCAVLTISDTRVPDTDKSGQLMKDYLMAAGHSVDHYQIVKDEPECVAAVVKRLAERSDIQAVLLNGGTGIAPRDTTYDAIAPLLTKALPGFGEIFRQLSYAEIGSRAMASRAIAGIHTSIHPKPKNSHKSTLIFSVPGSSKAVKLAMEALIMPELIHLTSLMGTDT